MDTSASSPCLRDARRAVDRLRASAERAAAASDEEAQRSGGDAGEAVYAADTARRAAWAAQHAAAALEALPVDSDDAAAPLPRRAPLPVRRVHASKLSLSSFRREVEARGEPVVLEGLGAHLTEDGAAGAELGWLRRHAATKTVAVSRAHAHTRCELRAADYELCTVGELLDAVDAGEADGSYLYDCSMPLKLPSLLQAVRVPRFFAHDFLQRTMRLHAFSASWPSLFVAAPGTQSSLHVDQWQGHFWMAMVRGTKRWTLFAADDVHLLSPDWARNTLDPAMPPLDRLDAEPSEHPLACLARRWEVDLGPGEVLYVPGGCPHHVRNLDEVRTRAAERRAQQAAHTPARGVCRRAALK